MYGNGENTSGKGTTKEADHLNSILTVTTQNVVCRKQKLGKLLGGEGAVIDVADKDKLLQFLSANHQNVFAIIKAERGETDLVQMTIDTGEAQPKLVCTTTQNPTGS